MKFAIAAGTALLAATAALPAAAQSFNGPYVGVEGGWNHDSVANVKGLKIDDSKDDFNVGGFAGYDKQITSKVVVGALVNVDATTSDKLTTTSASGSAQINPPIADLSVVNMPR